MNKKPCFFVHAGYSDYLEGIFGITRKHNPENRFILIGDDKNKHVAEKYNIEFYPLTDYDEEIPYYHFSPNSTDYEKFCFKRWFILKNFCMKHAITEFLHSDSDNAFFIDISTLNYTNARIGQKSQMVVPNVFFASTSYLTQICEYYIQLYSLPINVFFNKISDYCEKMSNGKYLYSDMYFLRQAIDELDLKFETLSENNTSLVFNANFKNYNISVSGNKPYRDNTLFQLANIHFCGSYKRYVGLFYNNSTNFESKTIFKQFTPVIFKYNHSINIGDEVQTIAAINFIEKSVDSSLCLPYVYINRDDDQENEDKNAKILSNVLNPVIICYGWMSAMTNLSYLKGIPTVILSIHYAGKENTYDTYCGFLSGRKILCRDTYTKALIKDTNKNIDCEFGGCLTLFLKPTYSIIEDYTYVVQVESEFPTVYDAFIRNSFPNIVSVSQDRPNCKDKMKEAEEHLSLIQRAKYVICSRIHTAIPCLAYRKRFSLIKFPNERRLTGFSDIFNSHWIHPNKISVDLLCPEFCGNIGKIEHLFEMNKQHLLDKIVKVLD